MSPHLLFEMFHIGHHGAQQQQQQQQQQQLLGVSWPRGATPSRHSRRYVFLLLVVEQENM